MTLDPLSTARRVCDECDYFGRVRRDFLGCYACAKCAEPITCHGCGQQDSKHHCDPEAGR